ncbi:MAG: aspartate kinase [Halanaerobiales bacterium]
MKKIVQKFGGTSLNSDQKRRRAVSRVKEALDNGYFPVLVVSAMGRLGDAYATDTLISKAEEIVPDIAPREKDLLMSCGEVISAVIMVQYLKKNGLEGVALTGAQAGIITNNSYGDSQIKRVNPERIYELYRENKIPVVAGFQGISDSGEITTLGRGGSDTTASILAEAIKADYIEIFTDVDGVMTADPTLVENACILKQISYNEVCELAYQGARVIHPRAAEIARNASIPIKVQSIYNDKPGTVIEQNNRIKTDGDRPITGVASRHNILFVKIIPEELTEYAGGLKVFRVLADSGISVDFINIRPVAISFIIREKYKDMIEYLLNEHGFDYRLNDEFVKISLVGGGMTGQPGIMAKIVEALSREDISIYQTTDSHTTISCLIKAESEKKALNVLHETFSLDQIPKFKEDKNERRFW